MDIATTRKLITINQTFYTQAATAFAETRQQPWEGWKQIIELVKPILPTNPIIADIGCGNGRFHTFLAKELEAYSYYGFDNSQDLLDLAKKAGKSSLSTTWHLWDLMTSPPDFSNRHFDWFNLYGVMHHIPGKAMRLKILQKLLTFLKPLGIMSVSFWHFQELPGFVSKAADTFTLQSLGINAGELEPGDYLLPFGNTEVWRYCHAFTHEETKHLMGSLPVSTVANFSTDGKNHLANEYYLGRLKEI